MHADAQVAVRQVFDGQCIVEILRVVGINGEGGYGAVIEASEQFANADAGGEGGGLAEHIRREFRLKAVLVIDRGQFGARFMRAAQAGDHRPLRIDVPLRPLVQLDHDLVADGGHRTHP